MKSILVIWICLLAMLNSQACEFCGCSTGNLFIGPYVHFQKHFVGVRYTFRSFDTRLKNDPTQFSSDFYQTIELYGGWNISKKIQLLVFVPYNNNRQNSDDGIKTNKGLGDISAIINYNLFSSSKMNAKGRMLKQDLYIGGGLKLPTGRFEADASSLVPSANNQVGTGTIDYILSSTYSLVFDRLGMSMNATYKINNSAKEYQFGNRVAANIFTSYTIPLKRFSFAPNVGLLYEQMEPNKVSKVKVADTGGRSLAAAAGVEFNINKFSVGLNVQAPVSENLSGNQTHTKMNGMGHVAIIL